MIFLDQRIQKLSILLISQRDGYKIKVLLYFRNNILFDLVKVTGKNRGKKFEIKSRITNFLI